MFRTSCLLDKNLQNISFKSKLANNLKNRSNEQVLFDGDDKLFKDLIRNIDTYFEYGCGKSTEYVYKFSNCNIYSVDTDQNWVKKTQKLTNGKEDNRLNIDWIDVGNVEKWGYPITYAKRKNFFNYANNFYKNIYKPDLVLIDGRFRIFCFLTTLKHAPIGTKIIFDDYTNRPMYHVAEEFLPLLDVCGRQALFEVNGKAKDIISNKTLLSFQNVLL